MTQHPFPDSKECRIENLEVRVCAMEKLLGELMDLTKEFQESSSKTLAEMTKGELK